MSTQMLTHGRTKRPRPLPRKNYGVFNALPISIRTLIQDALLTAAKDRSGPSGFKDEKDCLQSIECVSRDGFIAFSHNCGGLTYRNFATIADYWAGGYSVAHNNAENEIQKKIDDSIDFANEKFPGESDVAFDCRQEALANDDSTVMHEFRFMYHGRTDGLHSASISAAINTEAPYHRSSISWAPDVFCEGGKEIEITWRNTAELKRKLSRALKKVSKAVF